ncbi:MAG: hypothetical protein RR177_03810 [Oscillospiraceae bacterium]
MKFKHFIWIATAVVAIATMAAGVAVFVNRYICNKDKEYNYIECDCTPDED